MGEFFKAIGFVLCVYYALCGLVVLWETYVQIKADKE